MMMTNLTDNSTAKIPVDFANVNINYTNKKTNIYVGAFTGINYFTLKNSRKQYYYDSSTIFYLPPDSSDNLIVRNQFNNVAFGIDVYITPKHSLSYETNFNFSPIENSVTTALYDVQIKNDIASTDFVSNSITKTGNSTLNNSLFYIGNFNNKNQLNVSYTYSIYNSETSNENTYSDIIIDQFTYNKRNFSKLNAEYNLTLSNKVSFNFGYGNTYLTFNNDFDSDYSDPNNEITSFGYSDSRNQLYTYFSFKPNDKIGIKVGAAVENSLIKSENIRNSYWIYMPHADINFKPSPMFDVTLKYRSNSDYPDINQANPFEEVQNWQMVKVGNPELEPAKRNTVSLRFNVMSGLLTVEPYFNFTENYIINTITLREDGMWLSTYENAGRYTKPGVKANLTIPFSKSVIFQSSIDFYGEKISYNGKEYSLKDWPMNNQLFYMNKKTDLVAGLLYQKQLRKFISWNGYSTGYNDFWGIFLQKPFFKKQLNVMLAYMIPTNFGVDYNQGSYTFTDSYEEFNTINLYLLKNMMMFRVQYRFSKGKEIKRIEKDIDIEKSDDQKSFI